MNIREQILNSQDLPLHKTHVPEWGCDVWLRPLSGAGRWRLQQASKQNQPVYGCVMVSCLCDEQGNALFSDTDIDALNEKSGAVLERLTGELMKVNGLDAEAVDDAKKKLKANSERRFTFRLALALGCTVKELLQRIDSAELTEWIAYYHLEPFGEERADIRSAIIARTWGGGKLSDYMLKLETNEPQDWRQVKAYFIRKAKEDGIKHNRQGKPTPDCKLSTT